MLTTGARMVGRFTEETSETDKPRGWWVLKSLLALYLNRVPSMDCVQSTRAKISVSRRLQARRDKTSATKYLRYSELGLTSHTSSRIGDLYPLCLGVV